MLRELVLDQDALDRLHPCHLVIDPEARVVGAGRLLRRLLPELAEAPKLDAAFAITRPHGVTDFASLCQARDATFMLAARSRPAVKLKGGLLTVPGHAVFLTNLWLTDSDAIDALGLTVGDFGLGDATPDFIFLVETQAALLRNARVISEELVAARDAALSASRLKSDFLANMSHELRTPLNAIIGFSQLIAEQVAGPAPREYVDYAADIRDAGEHLLRLVNEILEFAKAESGELTLAREPISLKHVVAGCVRLMREQAERSGLQLELKASNDQVIVSGDETRLKQIVLNLLSNGIKFTRMGGRIRCTVEHDGQSAVLAITDTGIGMDAGGIRIAMEPFRQIEPPTRRQMQQGAGLGLPLARRLVELHGGTMEVTSMPGTGTTVTIRLPLARPGRDEAPAPSAAL